MIRFFLSLKTCLTEESQHMEVSSTDVMSLVKCCLGKLGFKQEHFQV